MLRLQPSGDAALVGRGEHTGIQNGGSVAAANQQHAPRVGLPLGYRKQRVVDRDGRL